MKFQRSPAISSVVDVDFENPTVVVIYETIASVSNALDTICNPWLGTSRGLSQSISYLYLLWID